MVPAVFVGVFFAGGPLSEKLGWRGYALPVLQKRYGWRVASLVIGAVWGGWHLPLFFVAGSTQGQTPVLVFIPTLPSDAAQRPSETVVGVFVLIALVWLFSADRAADWRVR